MLSTFSAYCRTAAGEGARSAIADPVRGHSPHFTVTCTVILFTNTVVFLSSLRLVSQ